MYMYLLYMLVILEVNNVNTIAGNRSVNGAFGTTIPTYTKQYSNIVNTNTGLLIQKSLKTASFNSFS